MADESLHRTGRTPEIIPLSEEIERIVLEKPELWNYNLLEAETVYPCVKNTVSEPSSFRYNFLQSNYSLWRLGSSKTIGSRWTYQNFQWHVVQLKPKGKENASNSELCSKQYRAWRLS